MSGINLVQDSTVSYSLISNVKLVATITGTIVYEVVSYTNLRAHKTGRNLEGRLLLEKKKTQNTVTNRTEAST